MGKLLSKIFGNKEMRILMLGLDAAGKTSILYSFYVAVFCVCRYKCVLSDRGWCDYIDDGVGMYICTFVYVHLQACRAVVCVCVYMIVSVLIYSSQHILPSTKYANFNTIWLQHLLHYYLNWLNFILKSHYLFKLISSQSEPFSMFVCVLCFVFLTWIFSLTCVQLFYIN